VPDDPPSTDVGGSAIIDMGRDSSHAHENSPDAHGAMLTRHATNNNDDDDDDDDDGGLAFRIRILVKTRSPRSLSGQAQFTRPRFVRWSMPMSPTRTMAVNESEPRQWAATTRKKSACEVLAEHLRRTFLQVWYVVRTTRRM
jgi:hypothetical protein